MHCVVFAIWVLLIPALGVSEGCVGKPRVRCAFLHSLFYVILVASFFHCLLSWDVSVISNYSLSPILPPRPLLPQAVQFVTHSTLSCLPNNRGSGFCLLIAV